VLGTIGAGHGAGPGQLASPSGIAVSPAGEIYVADTLNHRIQVGGER
jgi:tripartite motif-containing protein 71